jgi:hypothetical protein
VSVGLSVSFLYVKLVKCPTSVCNLEMSHIQFSVHPVLIIQFSVLETQLYF